MKYFSIQGLENHLRPADAAERIAKTLCSEDRSVKRLDTGLCQSWRSEPSIPNSDWDEVLGVTLTSIATF